MRRLTASERFWTKVEPTGFCWNWVATINASGYGRFGLVTHPRQRSIHAHRFAYQELVGPIPDGLQLDHLCRNRACVNPDHLEPVTNAENSRRGLRHALREYRCHKGHPTERSAHSTKCKVCESEPQICPHCGEWRNPSTVRKHLRPRGNEACRICGVTILVASMPRHLRSHEGAQHV